MIGAIGSLLTADAYYQPRSVTAGSGQELYLATHFSALLLRAYGGALRRLYPLPATLVLSAPGNPLNIDLALASRTPILVWGDAAWLAVGTAKNSPRTVRTCLTDLGSDARIFDDGEVVQLLKVAIEQEGNQTAFAKRHGINRTLLNEVANGKRHASGPILKALGLRKVYALDQNK